MTIPKNTQSAVIIYLHGFNSSPMSEKARQTADFCAARNVECIVPQLHHRPAKAIKQARQMLDEKTNDNAECTVIGSSMGGYYAAYLCQHYAGLRAVMINPAVKLADKLSGEVGKLQKNYHNGEEYVFTPEHLQEFAALDIPKLKDPSRCLLMVQTGDEVLDYREAVEYYDGAQQIVEEGGDHSFVGFAKHLPMLLNFHRRADAGKNGV